MNVNAAPQVGLYLDAYQYISDYFSYRKSQDRNFSFDKWSEELGQEFRAEQLKAIVLGDVLFTREFLNAFSSAAKLQVSDVKYLETLMKYAS